jgi:hypothetical protein
MGVIGACGVQSAALAASDRPPRPEPLPENEAMPRFILICLLLALPLSALWAEEPAETWTPQQVRAEFDALYETLRASHYDMFANRSRAAYDALFEGMRAGFDRPMTLDEIQQDFQRFVAYGNVAHAKIDPPMAAWETFRAKGGRAFPAFFRVVDGRVFVDDFMGDIPLSVGDEVLAVDGLPVLEWLEPLRAHLSADSDYLAHTLMENRLPILAWQEWGEVDAFTLTLDRGDEPPIEIDVPALSRDQFGETPDDRPVRFSLSWNARESRMLTDTIAYLRPGPFYDNRPEADHPWDPSAFKAFVDDAFESFIAAGAERVLIDLRNNPGGSNEFSDHLVAWFADRPFRFSEKFEIRVSEAAIASNRDRLDEQHDEADTVSTQLAAAYRGRSPGDEIDFPVDRVQPREGRGFRGEVFMLVNRHSYSNAVSVAAIGQDYGFATIIGEPTADLANTYGAMEHFTLPATGIRVGFPKARILRPSRDIEADTVTPDIEIEAPVAPVSDVMLERAVDILRATPSPDSTDSDHAL